MYEESSRGRVYVFIDAANIIYGCRSSGWRMDFAKLYLYLTKRFQASRILYYAGIETGNAKQMDFYDRMRAWGYEMVLKTVKTYRNDQGGIVRKANVDVDLTFDAMLYREEYDRAIFLTGDGDFYRLIAHLKEHKERILIIGNAKRTARELKLLMKHQFMNLDDLRSALAR